MNFRTGFAWALLLAVSTSAAFAESSPPSYQADPDVYKVIFENKDFRVISGTWKKGQIDKPHSHLLPFVIYALDDCTLRLRNSDGSSRDNVSKAGASFAGHITASHTAENISGHDCRALLIERK